MTNSEIADILKLFANLSELHGGNPFKIKIFTSASFRIDKMLIPLEGKTIDELETMEGIGKSIAAKIFEINTYETFKELTELVDATPEGVMQMMQIKGMGPKKVAMVWKELEINNIGELLYACKENRLAQAKGFGEKTQENILKQIEFIFASANKFHYAKALPVGQDLVKKLSEIEGIVKVSFCGDIRRKLEVLEQIEILVSCSDCHATMHKIIQQIPLTDIVPNNSFLTAKFEAFNIRIITTSSEKFTFELFKQTGSLSHVNQVLFKADLVSENINSENEIYESAKLGYIEPELREATWEIAKAADHTLPKLIEFTDLQGPLHNHSTWSDGKQTIEIMAKYCIKQGYQYLGMADHSKSAVYAKGLSVEKVLAQQQEIILLNQKMGPDFKIFAGIESDILYDGNLDYESDILKTFDYVVASVHSVLNMPEEKAMSRLIKAIENPFTTILGHPTGRLLLMREGYPINHHKIIDACAANGVIIEINANPYRLDLDWRYIDYALNKNVMLSINPDAHDLDGFYDMFFGVEIARKGGLNKEMCLNTLSLSELDQYFKSRKP